MGGVVAIVFWFCFFALLIGHGYTHPLCTDSREPFTTKPSLGFCQYNGSVCCNSTRDLQLQNQFNAMNVPAAPRCASIIKSILCSRCDPFSAELYGTGSVPRLVPNLCNAYCFEVWNQCHNVSVSNSVFAPSGGAGAASGKSFTKLTDFWDSETGFCSAFGGANTTCFGGGPVLKHNNIPGTLPSSGICLEKIANGSYLDMTALPDGSNRVLLASQSGKIWLATLPEEGSGKVLELDESNPFLDLTDQLHFDSEFGLMGIAFHPEFEQNGRLFASYNCDKVTSPGCSGRCSCNSDFGCDPSLLPSKDGGLPCQFHSVVAEYSANGTALQPPSTGMRLLPQEVRRILTMGLPYSAHHGGQILFGPEDGYLYFMMGDGGSKGDPQNFSQEKKSLLGKILRLDIDNVASAKVINDLGLWGNYSIPRDNPFTEDKDFKPEIWAMGFRNPWGCSFDATRPSYFLCADVGEEMFEEVNLVSKGGNYGWRIYEGPFIYNDTNSKVTANSSTMKSSMNPIFPVLGYNHSEVNKVETGSASITGGYFYRSTTDPCMYGRYLYADLYGGNVWAGTENPDDSGNFSTNLLEVKCAHDSPVACSSDAGTSALPWLGYIFSFGEDNRKDVFILASNGVYRIARPSRCNFVCPKENATLRGSPSSPTPRSSASGQGLRSSIIMQLTLFLLISIIRMSSL
ncbi:unnamed protein product [Linum trigynum]|uniref:Glucose/Sorbosone dehydrogenase domain-containing protein n=1 Tax=Linum trigynum TaxID=586398 RepID=A0AAV2CMQ1_9ROSI